MFAILAATALCVVGCVNTVTKEKPGKVLGYSDRIAKRIDQPVDKVFEAAKRALNSYGTITRESESVSGPSKLCFIDGTVNHYGVWIRIEEVSPSATMMTVQMRTTMGGTDLRMANELYERTVFELTP